MVSTVDIKPVTLAPLVPGNCAKRLPKNWVRDDVRGETMHTEESLRLVYSINTELTTGAESSWADFMMFGIVCTSLECRG